MTRNISRFIKGTVATLVEAALVVEQHQFIKQCGCHFGIIPVACVVERQQTQSLPHVENDSCFCLKAVGLIECEWKSIVVPGMRRLLALLTYCNTQIHTYLHPISIYQLQGVNRVDRDSKISLCAKLNSWFYIISKLLPGESILVSAGQESW